MTRYACTARIKEMMEGDGLRYLYRRVEELLNSGALDLETYPDTYQLPKIILTAALRDLAEEYAPRTLRDKKTVKNLTAF